MVGINQLESENSLPTNSPRKRKETKILNEWTNKQTIIKVESRINPGRNRIRKGCVVGTAINRDDEEKREREREEKGHNRLKYIVRERNL